MPTGEQLRYEALAEAVDQATTPGLLLRMFGSTGEGLQARVHILDGTTIEHELREVDLYSGELVVQVSAYTAIRLPLASVKSVWQRRKRTDRSLGFFAAVILVGASAAAVLATPALAVKGAFFGSIAVPLLLELFDHWAPLNEWKILYERGAA